MFSDFKKGKEILTFKRLLMLSEQKIDEIQEQIFFPNLPLSFFRPLRCWLSFLFFIHLYLYLRVYYLFMEIAWRMTMFNICVEYNQ